FAISARHANSERGIVDIEANIGRVRAARIMNRKNVLIAGGAQHPVNDGVARKWPLRIARAAIVAVDAAADVGWPVVVRLDLVYRRPAVRRTTVTTQIVAVVAGLGQIDETVAAVGDALAECVAGGGPRRLAFLAELDDAIAT